jgi:hypothetical protein
LGRIRELLILACTAVEAQLRFYLSEASVNPARRGFSTNDYFTLKEALHLIEFEISLPRYEDISPIRPFARWKASAPTKSLPWYDAYNSAKHEVKQLDAATLDVCIAAVAANVALFCARCGPAQLYGGSPCFRSCPSWWCKDAPPQICCPVTIGADRGACTLPFVRF